MVFFFVFFCFVLFWFFQLENHFRKRRNIISTCFLWRHQVHFNPCECHFVLQSISIICNRKLCCVFICLQLFHNDCSSPLALRNMRMRCSKNCFNQVVYSLNYYGIPSSNGRPSWFHISFLFVLFFLPILWTRVFGTACSTLKKLSYIVVTGSLVQNYPSPSVAIDTCTDETFSKDL